MTKDAKGISSSETRRPTWSSRRSMACSLCQIPPHRWPPDRPHLRQLHLTAVPALGQRVARMYQQYGDRTRSSPSISRKRTRSTSRSKANNEDRDDLCYAQPTNLAQRVLIAKDFVKRFDYDVPILIDGMENRADSLYAGWPERFYIVDESNTIVYKGKTGPGGCRPEEVEAWLAAGSRKSHPN